MRSYIARKCSLIANSADPVNPGSRAPVSRHVPINQRIYGETAMIKNIRSQMTRVLVLTVGVLATGVVAGAPPAVALPPAAASAGHVEANAGAGPRPGCIGDSFKGTLESTKAICNEKYLVRMQDNGDLVLREISTGRACWASKTRAPGDASATLHDNGLLDTNVDLTIDSVAQGELAKFFGKKPNFVVPDEVNASVSDKGEFWVGFTRVASC
jgi:hypothetical protein